MTETKRFMVHVDYGHTRLGTEWVEVELNWEQIALLLGPRACKNQSGQSTIMHGLITVRKVKPEAGA